MGKKIIHEVTESTPIWGSFESLVRQKVQSFVQEILEEEMNELLGRGRYERAQDVDASQGRRNGFGKTLRWFAFGSMGSTSRLEGVRIRGHCRP